MNHSIGKEKDSSKIHNGHRDRLKKRFINEGMDNFERHVILEMILNYAIPQKDTNPIAHSLLTQYDGSLSKVLDAPVEELMLVDGIGKNAAVLIKMFPEVCRRYLLDLNETGKIINSSQEVAKHVIPMFLCKTNEVVVIICLDGKGKIVFCNQVFEGSINAAAVSVRRIIEIAVRYATTDIIIAHNHPGGIAIPSEQDVLITEKISNALKIVGVRLLDHLIVAGSDWVSIASTPTLNEIFAQSSMFDIN